MNLVQVYNDLFDDGTPRRMKAIFKYLDRDERGAYTLCLTVPGLILLII